MPAGDASMDGQCHDLYAQAEATRGQSRLLAAELRATLLKTSQNWRLISTTWDQAEQIRKQRLERLTDPDRLRRSAYARLQAQLASMPVIERAKGIMMVKYGWSEDQAFEVMRRASQRENIKLRELAVRIVAGAARKAPAPRTAHPAATTAHTGRRPSPGQIPAVPRTTSEHRHNCQAHG